MPRATILERARPGSSCFTAELWASAKEPGMEAQLMSANDHPAWDRLEAFNRGDLAEADAMTIEDHLLVCRECQEGGVLP